MGCGLESLFWHDFSSRFTHDFYSKSSSLFTRTFLRRHWYWLGISWSEAGIEAWGWQRQLNFVGQRNQRTSRTRDTRLCCSRSFEVHCSIFLRHPNPEWTGWLYQPHDLWLLWSLDVCRWTHFSSLSQKDWGEKHERQLRSVSQCISFLLDSLGNESIQDHDGYSFLRQDIYPENEERKQTLFHRRWRRTLG